MSCSPASRAARTTSGPKPFVTATSVVRSGSAPALSIRARTSASRAGRSDATVATRSSAIEPHQQGLAPGVASGPVRVETRVAGRARRVVGHHLDPGPRQVRPRRGGEVEGRAALARDAPSLLTDPGGDRIEVRGPELVAGGVDAGAEYGPEGGETAGRGSPARVDQGTQAVDGRPDDPGVQAAPAGVDGADGRARWALGHEGDRRAVGGAHGEQRVRRG